MKTDDWKQIRISPEAEKIIIEHLVLKVSRLGKPVSKQEVLNELILRCKIAK